MLVWPGESLHVVGVRSDQVGVAIDCAADPVGIGDIGFAVTAEALANLFGSQLAEGIDLSSGYQARQRCGSRASAPNLGKRTCGHQDPVPGLVRQRQEASNPAIAPFEGGQRSGIED
jgi:hypothetical protein